MGAWVVVALILAQREMNRTAEEPDDEDFLDDEAGDEGFEVKRVSAAPVGPLNRPGLDLVGGQQWLVAFLRAQIGDNRGVHVETVGKALVQRGLCSGTFRVTELRRDLEEYGVPVRDGVKLAEVNRVGVHVDDLAFVVSAIADTVPASAATPPPVSGRAG